jgi:hypothetical protein
MKKGDTRKTIQNQEGDREAGRGGRQGVGKGAAKDDTGRTNINITKT